MKKPLPRESFSPCASKVSIATAEGLIRRTNSGRGSCEKVCGTGKIGNATAQSRTRIWRMERRARATFMTLQYNASAPVMRVRDNDDDCGDLEGLSIQA